MKVPFLKFLRHAIFWTSLASTATLCLRVFAQDPSGKPRGAEVSNIPAKPGWIEIPNTQLASHCPADPAIEGNTGCRAVIGAWNGGIADTKRNRLIIWGGGHSDYFGNEVYGLDLKTLTISRLNDPSQVTNVMSCRESYSDGRPTARHTYNGLAYLSDQDRMFVYGGSKSACGFMSDGTWMLDLQEMEWRSMDPHSGDSPANNPGVVAEYDVNSGMTFLSDTTSFFRYDSGANAYKKLSRLTGVDYHLSGVIDPDRRLFIMIGGPGQLWAIDIQRGSRFTVQDWSQKVSGCEQLIHAPAPGLAYDPESKLIVGWVGGDTVYLFHPDSRTCTSETYSGGPGPAQANGTFGRFRYFPQLGVFALVNDWKENAFLLRLAQHANTVATPIQHSNN